MGKRGWSVLGVGVLLALAAAGFLGGSPRAAVDWRSFPVVVFQSDDWGLAGFIPAEGALADLDRHLLGPGRFPEVYWGSTLEDSAAVAALCGVLESARGRDGLPAVLQANYVLSSLAWEGGAGGWTWREYLLPDFPAAYARPGMWQAVGQGIGRGVWRPEYHAFRHYDSGLRRRQVAENATARAAAERGIMLFPGSERAWELGPWRPAPELAAELDEGLRRFGDVFGRPPSSIIAPDYTWDGRCEDLWASRGLTVIQAKREQRYPGLGGGYGSRAWKYLVQRGERKAHPHRLYLERNCRFEPAQAPDAGAVVTQCLGEIRRAWARGEPAVVESHRINFAHTDPRLAGRGRDALQQLLAALCRQPRQAPHFLADGELAQLIRRGTSLQRRGPDLVIHNPTHAGRAVILDPEPGVEGAGPAATSWVLVPARTTLLIDRSGRVTARTI